MFGRLKDFRRIATRYDRLATHYLAAVCIAATVSYWLGGPSLGLAEEAEDLPSPLPGGVSVPERAGALA